jgi:hypothetical protein
MPRVTPASVHLPEGDPNGASYYTQGDESGQSFHSACRKFDQFIRFFVAPSSPRAGEARATPEQHFGLDAAQLNYEGIMTKDPRLINERVMDQFARWLATAARSEDRALGLQDDERRHLKLNTCDRYFSAMKKAIIRRCAQAGHENSPLENASRMKDIRFGMIAIIVERARQNREHLVNPHSASTDEDLIRIVNVRFA